MTRKFGGELRKQVKMKSLSDDLLVETYYKAIELQLSTEFITLIREEIERRSLLHKIKKSS